MEVNAGAKPETAADDSYMDQYAGEGTEGLQGGLPYLGVIQKVTNEEIEKGLRLGYWRVTGRDEPVGAKNKVKVIFVGWHRAWVEKNAEGRTVATHRINTIHISESGSGKDYKCTNSMTHNKIEKSYVIGVLVQDPSLAPEDKFAFLVPSSKSLPMFHELRKSLDAGRTKSGAKQPIFYSTWELETEMVKDTFEYAVISKFKRLDMTPAAMIASDIHPLIGTTEAPFDMKALPPPEYHDEIQADVEDEDVM